MDQAIATYAEQRVPRYTSYPTAPHFADAPDDTNHRTWLAALDPTEPVSLYLHVPFCKQVCWYCACNMKLAAREAPVRAYGKTLEREIALVADALPARLKVAHIHWGGGTPTAMPMDALGALMAELRARFEVLPDAEIAFELDPRTFLPEFAEGLAGLGATRASLGVQEFDAKVQETVNRIQPYEVVKRTVDSLRKAGIGAINFDLMYGLPHQTSDSIARSVEQTLTLRPDRIALFGYAHVPWMAKNQRLIPEDSLPGPCARFDQADLAADALVAAGYVRIGLDHFALPEDAMSAALATGHLRRNFQGYTVDDAPTLIGLGATSISAFPGAYVQNIAETGAWTRAIDSRTLADRQGPRVERRRPPAPRPDRAADVRPQGRCRRNRRPPRRCARNLPARTRQDISVYRGGTGHPRRFRVVGDRTRPSGPARRCVGVRRLPRGSCRPEAPRCSGLSGIPQAGR